jgi:AcrR family transcriptional regulator
MKDETTKRLNRDDRREQIIQAALKVFIEKGYTASTTAEIAKEAGISEVTLFRYFSSKREIFYAGVEPIMLNPLESTVSEVSGVMNKDQISQIIFQRIKFLGSNRGIIKLILNESILNHNEENYIHRMVINLKSLLEKHYIQGDDEFIIRILMGSFLSFLYQPETDDAQIKAYSDCISSLITESNLKKER